MQINLFSYGVQGFLGFKLLIWGLFKEESFCLKPLLGRKISAGGHLSGSLYCTVGMWPEYHFLWKI